MFIFSSGLNKCIEVIVADLLDNFMNIESLFKIIFLSYSERVDHITGVKLKSVMNIAIVVWTSVIDTTCANDFSFRKNFIKWFHRSCIDIDMYLIIDNSLSLKFKKINNDRFELFRAFSITIIT